MNTFVRAAQLADAEAIATVHVAAWRWAYDGLMPASLLEGLDTADRTKQWQRQLCSGDSGVFVAEQDGTIVGFVSCGPCRDGSGNAEIYALYLDRSVQGRGVGRALWQHAADWLRAGDYEQVQVWVLDTNTLARGFYETAGLKADGRSKTSQWAGAPLNEVSYSGPLT